MPNHDEPDVTDIQYDEATIARDIALARACMAAATQHNQDKEKQG